MRVVELWPCSRAMAVPASRRRISAGVRVGRGCVVRSVRDVWWGAKEDTGLKRSVAVGEMALVLTRAL